MRIALTGGFGSGKTTVAGLFRKKGAVVLDADAIVHDLFAGDRAVRAAIRRTFGDAAFTKAGAIDRVFLAKTIFAAPRRRRTLERIVHPAVRRKIRSGMAKAGKRVVVVDIPLLFESGWKERFDAVVVVTAGMDKRLRRLKARGFTAAEARRRIRAQMPLARKARLADLVIDNGGTIQKTRKQISAVWKKITSHRDVVRGTNGLTART